MFENCIFIAFEKFLALHHNSTMRYKMLSNKIFLETRIQQLLDGLIFIEKRLGVHVQRMLKMSRVYTLAEIFFKIFVKNEGKFGTFVRSS